jgi:hypothetical protein
MFMLLFLHALLFSRIFVLTVESRLRRSTG